MLLRVLAGLGLGGLGRDASSGNLVVVSVDDVVLEALYVGHAAPASSLDGVQLFLVAFEPGGVQLLGVRSVDILVSRGLPRRQSGCG